MHGDKTPTRGTERKAEGGQKSEAKSANRLRILLVDDEAQIRQSLAMALGDIDGHAVRECESGAAALELLVSEQFNLVITDNRMPGMEGDELARRIHAEFPGLPVVMLTGFSDQPIGTENPVKAIFHKDAKGITELREIIASLAH